MKKIIIFSIILFLGTQSCHDRLYDLSENTVPIEEIDYTDPNGMFDQLIGSYAAFQSRGWEQFLFLSVRGDDVNAAGDQAPLQETDVYDYKVTSWMSNSIWQTFYRDVYQCISAIEQIRLYEENIPGSSQKAEEYIAEIKVLYAFLLFHVDRNWNDIIIPQTSDPNELRLLPINTQEEVMAFISNLMDEAIPYLKDMTPGQRTDVPGGVTKYTALAIKALANLEIKNYQEVADATGAIINSGQFQLYDDYYNLFKIPGKLSDENLLEMQYSDFGQGSGDNTNFNSQCFGPTSWSPKVGDIAGGWGFFEPSLKYIKFLLDRNDEQRLQTSILFTPNGISKIKEDPEYANLPNYISNETPSGDVINNSARALFFSGKHYVPSEQYTPGRTRWGENRNYPCIRYSEILLMYAEALTQGGSGNAGTADQAVNLVRERVGLAPISNVTIDQVLDEKFAELGLEWGTRFYDLLRHEKLDELNYEGRSFNAKLKYLPYPQAQVDLIPQLADHNNID